MIRLFKGILLILLIGYIIIFCDAHVFGYTMSNEKVLDKSFKLSRTRKSVNSYWFYTTNAKINIDFDLYAALKVDKIIQVYRSKLFHTPVKIDCQVGIVPDTYNVCFTRTYSGVALISLFFSITFISLLLIERGTYKLGKIGLVFFLIFLFIATIVNHTYA